jgi:NAD-dependent DNA ligase
MTPLQLETEVMAHRYLYYVLSEQSVSDAEYDVLERKAREVCDSGSPVHGVGSSLASSYKSSEKELAVKLLNKETE